jgi:hypothetical protein
VNLLNVEFDVNNRASLETTSDTQIRFTFEEGANNGGVPVLDFSIFYNQGSQANSLILLESGVTTLFYQTSISLTAGETYEFQVTARNSVGSSAYSLPVAILAAKPPDAPVSFLEVPGQSTSSQVGI